MMKCMVKYLSVMALFLAVSSCLFAQKDAENYKKTLDNWKNEIWNWNKPEFKVRDIPAEYANLSSVVLARHNEIIADSKGKTKMIGLGFAVYKEMYVSNILRESIKLNDKSALADYSEISYVKLQKRVGPISEAVDATYLGIRLIKPDGKVSEINAEDFVTIKDTKSRKEAKVAIPDLQVGDIIDYFIVKQYKLVGTDNSRQEVFNHLFSFYDDMPVLNYSVHIELGRKYAVEYRAYNGAPEFKVSSNDAEDIVLDVAKKNIPPYKESNLWTSPFRQLPILRLNIMYAFKGNYGGGRKARNSGEVYKNQSSDEFIEDKMFAMAKNNIGYYDYGLYDLKDYYKNLRKNKDAISVDSLAAALYYIFRFNTFMKVRGNERIDDVVNRTRLDINNDSFIEILSKIFRNYEVDNTVVLTTSKYGPAMKEILGADFSSLIELKEGKQMLFGFADLFSPAFYVPAEFEQSKQAVTIDIKGNLNSKFNKFDLGTTNLPESKAIDNNHTETLVLSVKPETGLVLVDRVTKLSGHYKADTQKSLISFEDFYESERKDFGLGKSLVEDLSDGRKTKKFAEELGAALMEIRNKKKDKFLSEAKDWFDQEITDLDNCTLQNLGIRHNKPDFVYSSSFKMGGVLKKAGNNYILEIGKLQGTPLAISEQQRKRSLDVYMPFARSFNTKISLKIPEGYTVEGLAALNKKVENETGFFVTDASTDGSVVNITIRKSYNNAFEKVGHWDKLLAFIDASNEFSNAKVLFKKK